MRIATALATILALAGPAHAQIYQCRTDKHGQVTLDFGSKANATKSGSKQWANVKWGLFMVPSDRPKISTVVAIIDTGVNARGEQHPLFSPTTPLKWIEKEKPRQIRAELFDTDKTPTEIYGEHVNNANHFKCHPAFGETDVSTCVDKEYCKRMAKETSCGSNHDRSWCERVWPTHD